MTIIPGYVSEAEAARRIGIPRSTLKWNREQGHLNPRLAKTVQQPTVVYSEAEIEKIRAGNATVEYDPEQAQRDAIADGHARRLAVQAHLEEMIAEKMQEHELADGAFGKPEGDGHVRAVIAAHAPDLLADDYEQAAFDLIEEVYPVDPDQRS